MKKWTEAMEKQTKQLLVAHVNHFILVNILSDGLKTVWFALK